MHGSLKGSTVRIHFVPGDSFANASYTTSDASEQAAIERSPFYGNDIVLFATDSSSDEAAAVVDTESGASSSEGASAKPKNKGGRPPKTAVVLEP